jgi:hypothetical protein
MHLCAMGFGIVTAAVSLKLQLFNNADLWCWIASLSFNCTERLEDGETTCIRGERAYFYRWAFFYGPLWLCMMTVLILNVLMYCHVKRGQQDAIDNEVVHLDIQGNRTAWESSSGYRNTGQQQKMTSVRLNKPIHRRTTILRKSHLKRPSLLGCDLLQFEETVDRHTKEPEQHYECDFKMVLPETIVNSLRSRGLLCNVSGDTSHHHSSSDTCKDSKHSTRKSEDIRHVLAVVEDYPSAIKQYTAAYIFGTRVVVSQCFAYTVAFFLTWTFSSVNRIVQHHTNTNYFGLILCQALFEPLQGLFNVFVYRYAFYLRLKTRNPHLSRWELILSTWRWTYLGPPPGVQDRMSVKMSPMRGSVSVERRNMKGLLSPSARSLSVSKVQPGGLIELPTDGRRRESETGDEVYGLTSTDENHASSFTADLMMDYFDNPSLLNQNMVSIRSEFPFYISDGHDDNDEGSPDNFPVPLCSTSEYPLVLPIADFPITTTPLDEVGDPTYSIPMNDHHEYKVDETIEKSPAIPDVTGRL